MSNTARDGAMLILATEFLGVGARLGMRRTVRVALERDGRNLDDRKSGELLFQIVVFRFTFRDAKPPAIVMDRNGDMIRIVQRRRIGDGW